MIFSDARRFGLLLAGGRVRRMLLLAGLVLAALPAGAAQAIATTPPSVSLASHSGGTYDYQVVTGPAGLDWQPNSDVLVLSGLSGVTGASVSGDLAGGGDNLHCALSVSHTATSVTVSTSSGNCDFSGNTTIGTLEVDSSVTTAGTVNWAIENNLGVGGVPDNASGTTQGPVGPDFSGLLASSQGVGPGTSLADKVNTAQSEFQAGYSADACGTLNAYINEVRVQSGKKIDPTTARSLTAEAQQVQAAVPCT